MRRSHLIPRVTGLPPSEPQIKHPDELAQLPWFDAFVDAATPLVSSAGLSRQPVALIALEIDHFELIERTYGVQQSDAVLRQVASLLAGLVRPRDIVARRASAELLVLLPGIPISSAIDTAYRLAALVRAHPFPIADRPVPLAVTISAGVASAPEHGHTVPAVVAAAERARERVIRAGRDGAAAALRPAEEPPHRPLDVEQFVGRGDQLRTLARWLDDATRGTPRVVTVRGENGVGRSALLQQLAAETRLRGGEIVMGRCLEHEVPEPYAPWTEVLRGLQERLTRSGRAWQELPRLLPALAPMGGAELRGGSQFRLMEELRDFIAGAARERPLVIVLDEMQWADAPSLDALEHLASHAEDAPILICLTVRSDALDPELQDRLRQLTGGTAQEMTLSRLTRDEVKRWVEAAFHGQEVGRELLAFVYRHTEGNPLFIEQLLRTLVEEKAVWNSGDRWEWQPVSALRLPVGLDALIAHRLDRLSESAQAVLGAASLLDGAFDASLLTAIGAGDAEAVEGALAEARAAALIRRVGRGAPERLAFSHEQVAAVLRMRLSPREAQRAHALIGQALAERGSASTAVLARHFDRGGRTGEAHAAALRASSDAEALYAHASASELLRVAARNANTPDELAEVRVRLAGLAELAGRYDEAEELCDLAIEWFARQDDRARTLSLRRIRERVRSQLGQPARRTLDAVLALDEEAKAAGLDAERVAILTLLSRTYGLLGDPAAAERVASECVRMAERIGDPSHLADALTRLANTIRRAQPDRSREIYRRALGLYEEIGDFRGQAGCYNNLGNCADQQGRLDEAREALSRALTLARAAGLPDVRGVAALNLGVMSMRAGEHDRARELFGEALALFASVKNSEMQLYALYNLAHLDREQEEYASAASLYEVATSLAQRVGQSDVELGAQGAAGLCHLHLGDMEQARRIMVALDSRLEAYGHWFQGRELIEALRVHLAMTEGREEDAIATFERARALADPADLYAGAWLTASCARAIHMNDPEARRQRLERYRERMPSASFEDLLERYAVEAGPP